MGYYADLIKQKQEKRNSKYSYKLIDKGYYGVRKEEEYHKWVVQTWYGTKLVDEQEVTGPKSKAEAQGQKNVSAFERRYQENSKEEKDNANFHYLGKTFSVTSGNYKDVRRQIEQTYKDAVSKLEHKISGATGSEKAKLEADLREIKSGYKETLEEFDWGFGNEKEKGYYAKLAEEKKSAKNQKGDAKLVAVSMIDDGYTIDKAKRELKSQYGYTDKEIFEAIAFAIGVNTINKQKK